MQSPIIRAGKCIMSSRGGSEEIDQEVLSQIAKWGEILWVFIPVWSNNSSSRAASKKFTYFNADE